MELAGKRIVLGMTGGIAAYKVCDLVRRLQDEGASVQVVMTRAAQEFVTATTLQALSGQPVFTDQWGAEGARVGNAMPHIDVSRAADAVVVAPASAHFIAKTAQGLADDLLCTLVLARRCPLLVAPAMNVEMWSNPATQRNVQQLKADGIEILGPGVGDQACGETGAGRMLEPQELLEDIIAFFQPKLLQDKRVLVTAGPTFEPIDPVRGITNLSSGKMGYAIARACRHAGAQVVLVSGPTALAAPDGVRRVDVRSAHDMLHAVQAEVAGQDVFISVAAVADWNIANASDHKLKKTEGGGGPTLEFAQNPDILATVAAMPGGPFCVGFAAETEDLEANAQEKRRRKGVPLLIGNLGQATFGRDDNELLVIDAQGSTRLPRASKTALAASLVGEIARRLPQARC